MRRIGSTSSPRPAASSWRADGRPATEGNGRRAAPHAGRRRRPRPPHVGGLEDALDPLPVARVDFPYRREGRRAPDRAPKLIACVVEEAAALRRRPRSIDPASIVLGGRSMGGRMCSMAVAEGLPAAGLVLHQLSAASAGQARQAADRAPPRAEGAVPVRVGHQGPVRHARGARGGHRRRSPDRSRTSGSRTAGTTCGGRTRSSSRRCRTGSPASRPRDRLAEAVHAAGVSRARRPRRPPG